MQNYQNPKPSTDIWKSPGLLPQTTHLEILLYIEFWTFNSPKVVKYGIIIFFQFTSCSSRVQIMEARPATSQDMHLAPGESVPTAGNQTLNDRGQRDRTRD